jgi:hypothetical protein
VLNNYDELYQNSYRIKHILTTHEQGAAHAADAIARDGQDRRVHRDIRPRGDEPRDGNRNGVSRFGPGRVHHGNVNVNLNGKDSFQEADIAGITTRSQKITKSSRTFRRLRTSCGKLSPLPRKAAGSGACGHLKM